MNKNMELWNNVSKTDPSHTKKVTFGRAITAIDPYRQIEAATKQFGPAGQGWGWDVKRVEYTSTNQVAILVSMWIVDNDINEPHQRDRRIEQWGQSALFIDNAEKKKDEDCFKKATTDGITKCLSYMGFNADIFLGKFDDNKYVNQMKEEFAKPKTPLVDVIGELVKLKIGSKESIDAVIKTAGLTSETLNIAWADPKRKDGLIDFVKAQLEAK